MKLSLILIIVALFTIYSISIYKLGASNEKIKYISQIDTLITYRTITDTRIIPKYTTITKLDTVYQNDTVFIKEVNTYIAEKDTTYENDLAKLKVQYVSDIPLSKKSYFNLELNVKSTTVFVPTYKAYEPDKWSIGGGVAAHFNDSVKVNIIGNISYKIMNFKNFEMPITAEIQLDDNFRISDKIFKVEGRVKF